MKQNDWSELLTVLAQLREEAPDVRFGQLIANLATLARNPEPESVWDVDDAELMTAAKQLLENLQARQAVEMR